MGGALPGGGFAGKARIGLSGASVCRVRLSGAKGSIVVLREGMEPARVLGRLGR